MRKIRFNRSGQSIAATSSKRPPLEQALQALPPWTSQSPLAFAVSSPEGGCQADTFPPNRVSTLTNLPGWEQLASHPVQPLDEISNRGKLGTRERISRECISIGNADRLASREHRYSRQSRRRVFAPRYRGTVSRYAAEGGGKTL